MKNNDDVVRAPCPECRQMINEDRMGKHLRKAHHYDLRRTRVFDDARQGIGRVVVAESAWGLPASHDRAPVTKRKKNKTQKRIKAAPSAITNPPKKVFRAHPPAVPASKTNDYFRRLDEDSLKRYIATSRDDTPKGYAPGLSELGAKALGYASYKGYLGSKKWKRIRVRVLERDGHACRWCGWYYREQTWDPNGRVWKYAFIPDEADRHLEVHHEDYSFPTMCGDTIEGLTALCHKCHTKATHNNQSGRRTF